MSHGEFVALTLVVVWGMIVVVSGGVPGWGQCARRSGVRAVGNKRSRRLDAIQREGLHLFSGLFARVDTLDASCVCA